MNTRRSRVLSVPIAEDGSVELPEGSIIISLDFESGGPYGYQARPVTAWVEIPFES